MLCRRGRERSGHRRVGGFLDTVSHSAAASALRGRRAVLQAESGFHGRGLAVAVTVSGAAALIWEVLWQHYCTLAFGASARGAAITLASLMAGFAAGALLAARLARRGCLTRPLAAYGIAEIVIAAGGLLVPVGVKGLAWLDTVVFQVSPAAAPLVHAVGAAMLLIVPAAAMGATLPILARCTGMAGVSLAALYACNTFGAVLGVVTATFVTLPLLGVLGTALLAAAAELAVALWALRAAQPSGELSASEARDQPLRASLLVLAFLSGQTIFALEVSWFRSARAAFQSTTDTFAIVIAAFLLPLAAGAWIAPPLRRRNPAALRFVILAAGLAILVFTPIVDRLDRWAPWSYTPFLQLWRLLLVLGVFALPLTVAGVVFPWLLDDTRTTSGVGRLYVANTAGAVAGALLSGFVLLPSIGATRTSWLAAACLLLAALGWSLRRRSLVPSLAATAAAIAIAVSLDSGPGRQRIQGAGSDSWRRILFVAEGPDATVAVVEGPGGQRHLVIDGFVASAGGALAHYMRWMGHLPALATPRLDAALVICFGTGQTADAVRRHGPRVLDLVDLNAAVFTAAPLFPANGGVLDDPRTNAVVMDGRAFLRRSVGRRWDLITLEPMPPDFAGSNNLFSIEFYELLRARLAPAGIAAQWVPLHLVSPESMTAIIATFAKVFPFSRLYVDYVDGTGVLLGGTQPWHLHPSTIPLDLPDDGIEASFLLGYSDLAKLAAFGEVISDDNQLLAYGRDRSRSWRGRNVAALNRALLATFSSSEARWVQGLLRYGGRLRNLSTPPPETPDLR